MRPWGFDFVLCHRLSHRHGDVLRGNRRLELLLDLKRLLARKREWGHIRCGICGRNFLLWGQQLLFHIYFEGIRRICEFIFSVVVLQFLLGQDGRRNDVNCLWSEWQDNV